MIGYSYEYDESDLLAKTYLGRLDSAAFIESLAPEVERIMTGRSWPKPFASKQELAAWCKDNQPYYKKRIPGVNNYFARLYNLK